MAKIVGHIQAEELQARIKQAKKIRFQKPLKVSFGAVLKAAMEAKAHTTK